MTLTNIIGRYLKLPMVLRLLAAASMVTYLIAILLAQPWIHSSYTVETQTCVPSVVSHLVDHTPWGFNDPNIMQTFARASSGSSSPAQAFALARTAPLPGGDQLQPISSDGNGVGCVLFAAVAFKLFGLGVGSLVLAFVAMLVVSGLAMLGRFRDGRLLVLPVVYGAMTLVMASPLGSTSWGLNQAPIGGVRYFPAAAALPALHIFFELTDRHITGPRRARRTAFMLLAVQALIFGCVVLVRSEALCLVFGILVATLLLLRRAIKQRDKERAVAEIKKSLLVAAASGLVLVAGWAFVQSTPYDRYPLFGTAWTRAFASFGASPSWPFSGVRRAFPCSELIKDGMEPGIQDIDPRCAYVAWGTAHGQTFAQFERQFDGPSEELDNQWDGIMRGAWFRVVRMDPVDSLVTYIYYKPKLIATMLPLPLELTAGKPVVDLCIAGQALVAVLFGVVAGLRDDGAGRGSRVATIAVGALGISSLIAYIEAWCALQTATSLFLWELCCCVLAVALTSEAATRRFLVSRRKGTSLGGHSGRGRRPRTQLNTSIGEAVRT